MKKFYILLIMMLAFNVANAQWVEQISPSINNLYSVYFTDTDTGYIVGGYLQGQNDILKTTDGGENWESQTSGITGCLYSVHFPSKDTGYAVGDGGVILKTTNGGTNWLSQNSGTNFNLSSVYFPAADAGFIAGYLNSTIKIFSTTDGTNWVVKYSSTPIFCDNAWLYSVHFSDVNTGYAVGAVRNGTSLSGILLKTTDGGTNWTSPYVSGEFIECANSVYFTDANTGYIVGRRNFGQNKILKTADGGENWTSYELENSLCLNSIYFPHPNTGYTVGYEYNNSVGVILKTTDGGGNWTTQNSGTSIQLNSVFFTDVNTGYAVGNDGTILKTTNGGAVGINDHNQTSKTLTIYPNPATDKIKIKTTTIPVKSELSICNLHGQELILRQITEPKTVIDISILPSGVYVVKVIGERGVQVGKVIKQ
jgi:photosystem II stability/assembly factor-like uncharacterized protein